MLDTYRTLFSVVEGINLHIADKIDEIFVLYKFDSPMEKDKNIKIKVKW